MLYNNFMEKYLNTKKAAEFLGLTVNHISDLCKTGRLKCEKPARDWFVSIEELEAYKIKPKNKGGRPKKIRS